METPFKVLSIESMDTQLEITELGQRLEELIKLQDLIAQTINSSKIASINAYNLTKGDTIEEILNERFILGLPVDKKFFDQDDYKKLFELKSKKESNSTNEEKIIMQSVIRQVDRLSKEIEEYRRVLENYEANPEASTDEVHDLYVRSKFESSVINVAQKMESSLPRTEKIEKDDTFFDKLTNTPMYKELSEAYGKVATAKGRADLVPELYVKMRNADPSGILAFTDEKIKELVKTEKTYREQWQANMKKSPKVRAQNGISENQYHDHSWGIVLTTPKMLLGDESIDTPIFKGKITVERLGHFTEESLFRKRKFIKQKKSNSKFKQSKKQDTEDAYKIDSKKSSHSRIRNYFYAYEAKKSLIDNIYRVTKTDTEGRISTGIVFSPISSDDITEETLDFVKNIYFSDYMLGLAAKNGGYAGRIIKSPQGLSISNKYSKEEISSAILFDRGARGSICDYRNGNQKIHHGKNKLDFLRMIGEPERERLHDE